MAILPAKNYEPVTFGMGRLEACSIQKDLIKNWEPKSEVWTLKYGHGILGLLAAGNSYFINLLFRQKLRLLHNGYVTSSILLAIGPGFIATVAHEQLISNKIFLYEVGCVPCEGLKAAVALNLSAIAYPLLLAPAVSLSIAANIGYRIPHIFEYKELLKLWWSVFKPNSGKLAHLAFLNALIANVLTYRQSKSMEIVTNVLQLVQNYSSDQGELK